MTENARNNTRVQLLNESPCGICREEFIAGDQYSRCRQCSSPFHTNRCLGAWFTQRRLQGLALECPMCRNNTGFNNFTARALPQVPAQVPAQVQVAPVADPNTIILAGAELNLPVPIYTLALSGGNTVPPTISRIPVLIGHINGGIQERIIRSDPTGRLEDIFNNTVNNFFTHVPQFLTAQAGVRLSHIFCPFIWRLLERFDPNHRGNGTIPVTWLTYGPRSCGLFSNITCQGSNLTFLNNYSTNLSTPLLYSDPQAVAIWDTALALIEASYTQAQLLALITRIKAILNNPVAGGKRSKKTRRHKR